MADYDVVVIGAGMAGLTAGLYAARYGRSVLVLEPTVPGGHLVNVEKIEDFPGFAEGVSGFELGPAVQEQAANEGAEFGMEPGTGLEPAGDGWAVVTDGDRHGARAVIVASGTRLRELGVPGEERLSGKGVSHCASCDGPLFRGGTVGVVAGDGWAYQEALTLAGFASRVLLFEDAEVLPAGHVHRRRVAETSQIVVRADAAVEEILGEGTVAGVRVRDTASGEVTDVELAGLFVYAGLAPNSALLGDLVSLDASGHVPTDHWMRTARPGLFAAGSIRAESAGLAITAASDGAVAALAAHRYIEDRSWPSR
jgi:thioredoxin reductase (NADPH)